MSALVILTLLAASQNVMTGAVPCGQIETMIQALGYDSAINTAKQHGATDAQIRATLKRCKIKAPRNG